MWKFLLKWFILYSIFDHFDMIILRQSIPFAEELELGIHEIFGSILSMPFFVQIL